MVLLLGFAGLRSCGDHERNLQSSCRLMTNLPPVNDRFSAALTPGYSRWLPSEYAICRSFASDLHRERETRAANDLF
jgi:hypothetical protein